jgi:cytochrome c-type biogenesis protein CcmH/NrfG
VAYRLAQSATMSGDARGALAAWERVQRLDPHHIYRTETVCALRRLQDEAPSDANHA